ncbi:hypothetical protein GCM10007973_27150 [Polymorphobacter multimanifer]|uniref:DUF2891 domain-containing protein n=1 Tax=Polymorphobacter multimanifer TaxID=1070431 RepID=UPI00166A4837|nr:DUF2891 domain-containing protein [Polymorphobacter multimanifer]GGI89329.1 hypothetical protein GCM10007973_27150 [Polymorphobacter multimanifer]
MRLGPDIAQHMAETALGHVQREYPHAAQQVLESDEDLLPPRALHPMFFGSFDWHSCVHGWWLLLRLARLYPDLATSAATRELAASTFSADKVATEVAWFLRPSARGFERPYGWAWLLALHHEARHHGFGAVLDPLAAIIARGFHGYLPALTYPIRTGAHANTGFALCLIAPWARANDPALLALMAARAEAWFGGDKDAQAWEPDGDAFLSPTLVEALAMARLHGQGFADWFAAFLPEAGGRRPARLFTPAEVSDRTDGKIAHLDGLNLSRAWCWRGISAALAGGEAAMADVAEAHLAASLPHIAGDYAGAHWLASFALLALAGDDES